jgi:PAS domain S-box-containing protein
VSDARRGAVEILLLEDSDVDAELLAGHLAKAGMDTHITRAADRRGFVAALEGGVFDILLADYALPDFDGLSALDLARRACPDTPFIFVSGVVGEEFATSALKLGAADYVVKRNLSRLAAAIERALSDARGRLEKRRAEEALRRLNATLEAQVEARTRERDRIWRLSLDLFAAAECGGRLLAVNPAWWRLTGLDETDLLARGFDELTHPDDRDGVRAVLAALTAGEPVERFEVRLGRRDGAWRWVSWTAAPEGAVFYAVGRDITAQKLAAAELARANASLKAEIVEREAVERTLRQMQRLEAIGQLTSGVAHDFNNLLTVILGNVGFLEQDVEAAPEPGRGRRRIDHIRAAAERGARLTAQLLAFSRRQRLEPRPVDLNETVASMRDLLQSTMGGAIRLETVLRPALWPAMVDPTQIEMIILNLAINARDAMEVGGGLTVETANVRLGPAARPEEPVAGDYVALIVSDTGCGMTDEVRAKAFEPFFTTKGPGRGSGLGLAQVLGFAKQSGGGVALDTRPGEGASVKVYLPRAADGQATASAPRTVRAPVPGAPAQARILLVDDDSAVRDVTATILQEIGYAVVEAGSGGAAIEILAREPVDILLVDYAMPGMNGIETATAAREVRPDLPVLFVTGYADLTALREVGEDRIVQKPFRDNELEQKLRRFVAGPAPGNVVDLPRRGPSARVS